MRSWRPTSQISSQHEIKNKEAVLVVLERVSQIDHKWVIDLSWLAHCKSYEHLTSSNNLRSCTMLATAFIFTHFALLMYLSAYSVLDCLCWTTRTWMSA